MNKTVLAAIALALVAGPAQALLQPDPSRFDLENQVPGAVIEKSLTIRNQADRPTEFDLQVVRFQEENVTISPQRLSLGPWESGTIDVTIRLADDAAGGRHDLRVTATEGAPQTADGVGTRSAVRMPIIFHVENLKIASLHVNDALSGSPGNAMAMVFNHLSEQTGVTMHVLVRNQDGQEVLRTQSGVESIPPEEHRFLSVPIDGLQSGAYTIEAWTEHAGGRSNSMVDAYAVGVKAVQVSSAQVEPFGDGLYRLSADFANAGTVGLAVDTSFHIRGPDGYRTVAAPSYTIEPAESVTSTISVRLEPGTHFIKPVAGWDGGGSSSPGITYTASQDDQPEVDNVHVPWPYVAGGAGIAAGLAIALVRRRRSS